MGNSVEYISYNCVLFSYSQGRAESGGIASFANFSSQYCREFHGKQDLFEINLLQLSTHPQHS